MDLFLAVGAVPSRGEFATWRLGWCWGNGGCWALHSARTERQRKCEHRRWRRHPGEHQHQQ